MTRDAGEHMYKDVREQQRGFRKVTGGAGGMRLATLMLLALLAVGLIGILAYMASDQRPSTSNSPPSPAAQKDQTTIPAPPDAAKKK